MSVDRSYIEENQTQQRRLRGLIDQLTDEQLGQPMDAGWTVGGVLAHMAFWDYRIVTMLARWGPNGSGLPPTDEGEDVDWINDAAKPIFLAIPPRVAAGIAIEAADAADRAVAEMSDELLAKDEEIGWIISPLRAEHRQEHLDELEEALRSP